MVTLRIRLLGEFALFYDGAPPRAVDSQRQQCLLAYLLLHHDAPQSRQRLAFLFWPDSTETQARTNFRNLLHTLARDLPEGERFIQAEGQTVQWRSDAPFTLDVDDFLAAVKEAGSAAEWQRAADLYTGLLLPGCYDDWIATERERLEDRYVLALRQAVSAFEAEGAYEDAIAHAWRLARQDPLREEHFRDLFRLYWQIGDRAGVVKAFKECEAILRRELDVEPSAETCAAYEKYLREPPPPRGEPPRRLRNESSSEEPSPPVPAPEPEPPAPGPKPPVPKPRWIDEHGRTVRKVLNGLNYAAPLAALVLLVLGAQVAVPLALAFSALLFTGLFLVLNPKTGAQQEQADNAGEAREHLTKSGADVQRIRALAPGLGRGAMQERVLRICDLTESIIHELWGRETGSLLAAARIEHLAQSNLSMVERYLQIKQGRLAAPPDRLAAAAAMIEGLFDLIESSLRDFAVRLDVAEMAELEASIHVLEMTLRDEGLGQ